MFLYNLFRKLGNGGVMKVKTENGYDFYIGKTYNGTKFYNFAPEGSKPPTGGFFDRDYIELYYGLTF